MFTGFSDDTFDFLFGLSLHNERPWFQAHKQEFLDVLKVPFDQLGGQTLELMRDARPQMDFQIHISRIYRDARRLFGRGPYKDHLWFTIQPVETRSVGTVFWFEISPEGCTHGVGCWNCSADQAARFRAKVDAHPARFEDILLGLPDRDKLRLWGTEYKRPKADRSPLLNPWYNRREVSAGYENLFGKAIYTPGLPQLLAEHFQKLLPLYDFLREAYTMDN